MPTSVAPSAPMKSYPAAQAPVSAPAPTYAATQAPSAPIKSMPTSVAPSAPMKSYPAAQAPMSVPSKTLPTVSGQYPSSPSKMIPGPSSAPIPTKTPMAPTISPAPQAAAPVAAPAPAPATAAPRHRLPRLRPRKPPAPPRSCHGCQEDLIFRDSDFGLTDTPVLKRPGFFFAALVTASLLACETLLPL